jgi:sugar lactone lactonase YvrE
MVLALPAGSARPQSATGIAAVDSASVARNAWSRAGAALRARDIATALREMIRAAAAWPTQPAYLWGRAVVAARANDTTGLIQALGDYAALGFGRDLRADTAITRYLALPGVAEIAAAHRANLVPFVSSRQRAVLTDSTFWPEGMDYDPRTGRFYVASIRHRTIAELTPGKPPRELWPRDRPDLGAVYGVRVDTARGVLWATVSPRPRIQGDAPADSGAALLRVRIADGLVERRWTLSPSSPGHALGDVAVGPRGDVFMTDSNEPVLYRLRPSRDTLERITSPLFRSLQGMAPTPDGRIVYVADYSHGLLRVDLAGGAVTRLTDAPHSSSLGCDGIAWDRGAIIAVQNGVFPARVVRFVLDVPGDRIVRADLLDRNSTVADEPTIGAIAGREFVYVANSQWEKFSDDGARKPSLPLTAPVLLAVPLPR